MTLNGACVNITNVASAGLSELADEADSKSVGGNIVRVQVPQPALNGAKPNPVYFFKKVFAVVVNFTRK